MLTRQAARLHIRPHAKHSRLTIVYRTCGSHNAADSAILHTDIHDFRLLATLFAQDSAFLDYTAWALRIFMATSVVMGIQIACQQTFIAIGNAKTSLFLAIYRKIILLIPLIYILPYFFENKVMAVFLAEPVADVIAVTTTLILFVWQFKKALQELRE